ncbi:MAG: LysR family transcriptional regulator [Gallionella sp.]|nr:LysR family transcriptional regulator [Gallionella sp.]
MNLDQVASFLAIFRHGSFRAGARERSLSQGAISQQMQKLEMQLGARLIERDAAGCRLTTEGMAFKPYAENLLRLSTNAAGIFLSKPVVIGASSNIGIYLLSGYVKDFLDLQETPKTQLDVRIDKNPSIAQQLDSGDIDVAVMEWWDGREGYEARPWRQEELVVIVPPSHPWADKHSLSHGDLMGVPLLGGEPGTGTGRILADYFGSGESGLSVGMQLGSTDAVKQWVKAGLGVSIVLVGTVSEEVQSGTLVPIALEGGNLRKELYVIWRDTLSLGHPARRFGEWLAGKG